MKKQDLERHPFYRHNAIEGLGLESFCNHDIKTRSEKEKI